MFNVPSKIFLSVLVLALLVSCVKGEKSDVSDLTPQELADEIQKSLIEKEYSRAIDLIDTLNIKYSKHLSLRKKTLLWRAEAMEGIIRDSIPLIEMQLTSAQLEMDSLMKFFVPVKSNDIVLYYVDKNFKDISYSTGNAVQPRIGSKLNSWALVVTINGIKDINGMKIDGAKGLIAEIYPENMQNRRLKNENSEAVSFDSRELEKLTEVLKEGADRKIALTLDGDKGSTTMALTPEAQQAISRTASFVNASLRYHKAKNERELLERKLIVAQNQVANFK